MPEVRLERLDAARAAFTLAECPGPVANALRRAMIAEVPTLAVDSVAIDANGTTFQDEFLAHRIGLVPLRGEVDGAELALDVRNDGAEVRHVTSDDLVGDDVEPVPGVLLLSLKSGQHVKLRATCKRGIGKEHAKFIPTVRLGYAPLDDATVRFDVESVGPLPAAEIVIAAADLLRRKLDTLRSQLDA